jgi:hypothetical protein
MQFSLTDAAHVLGMLPWEAEEILGAGPYELDAVEQAALEHYRPHAHARDPYSYWVTTTQAAAILGISDVRVRELIACGTSRSRCESTAPGIRAGSIPTTDAGRVRAAGRATSVRLGAPRCSH